MFPENVFFHALRNVLIGKTDLYKVCHPSMYPNGITRLYGYGECRAGAVVDEIPFVGLQAFLHEHLSGIRITKEDVDAFDALMKRRLPPGSKGFDRSRLDYLVSVHGGRLPLAIWAAPEGLVVPKGNVVIAAEATDPECFWLWPAIDSLMMHLYSPQGVAANSREMKKILWDALVMSGTTTKENVGGMLIDFGHRSCLGAALAGLGHLALSRSSDNIPAIDMAEQYYHGTDERYHGELASSVVASEHTVSLTWEDAEIDMVRTWLKRFPDEPVSIVLDTRDPFNFLDHVFRTFRTEILSRPAHAPVVARPDSGIPEECLPQYFKILFDIFGYHKNPKGYGVLPPQLRMLQGDAVSRAGLPPMIDALLKEKISIDNMLFGSGGALLTELGRKEMDFVIKASWMIKDGREISMRKTPKTQSLKNSKAGRFWLDTTTGVPRTVSEGTAGCNDVLELAFLNGEVKTDHHFREIRERADIDYGGNIGK